MSLAGVTHVALRSENVRQAEEFYGRLFDLAVAFREVETTDEWLSMPSGTGWAEAEAHSQEIGLVMLYRDGFRVTIEAAPEVSRQSLPSTATFSAVQMSSCDFEAICLAATARLLSIGNSPWALMIRLLSAGY
jgi:hypothetical protein